MNLLKSLCFITMFVYVLNTYTSESKDMAKSKKFRSPKDIPVQEKTHPVSARIKESTLSDLKKIAKKNGHNLSWIIVHALEDYVDYVKESKD